MYFEKIKHAPMYRRSFNKMGYCTTFCKKEMTLNNFKNFAS